MTDEAIDRARAAIASAEALLIAAGAGMGVDSGLPDFRGPEGFWRAYPAARALGLGFEQLANPRWFDRDPNLAWGFYGHRANLYRATPPHAGFALLLKLAREKSSHFVFTSNVDDHFHAAGFDHDRIVECHGSIAHLQCARPCGDDIWPSDAGIVVDEPTLRAADPLPRCRRCGSVARPNILTFGDSHWVERRQQLQQERFAAWMESVDQQRLAILEFGAGTAVPTVRLTCQHLAAIHQHATLIRVNPRESDVLPPHISIPLPALTAIRRLLGIS